MMNANYLTPSQNLNYLHAVSRKTVAKYRLPLFLVLLHVPLGIMLYQSKALALLHPWGVFLFGLYLAINKQEKIERVVYVVAYMIGVEVLWRMADAPVFWEFGKYGSGTIMIAALVQRRCWKIPPLPLVFFVLLLPGCLLAIADNDLSEAKDKISFNMSGPFLLLVSCWFFFNVKMDWLQIKKLLVTFLIPLTSVAITTFFYTVTAEDLQFNTESNFATSGGFGPNQVSAMLGLGACFCMASYLLFRNRLSEKIYFGIMAAIFTAQSIMTFSRGGMYNAIGTLLVIIFFQMKDARQGIKRLLPIMGIAVLFLLFIFPVLNEFTGGALLERFEESETTGRTEIIESDLQIFDENPILGTGVGKSYSYREKFLSHEAASHTEFSRLISEHGLFGILALITLFYMTVLNIMRQKTSTGKALAAGLAVWSILFMLNAGMRLSSPAFIWGASFLTISGVKPRTNQAKKSNL